MVRLFSAPEPRSAKGDARTRLFALLSSMVLGLVGCHDLDQFELSEQEAFCGSLVSAPVFQEGLLPDGVPPALRMRLHLDVKALAHRPGTLTTDDAERGLCSDQGSALFEEAPLRTVAEALHDPISTASLGQGRDRNVLAYVDSSCGHNLLSVISLMAGGGVEVRLFKPAPEPEEGTPRGERPGFGLFVLERQKLTDCAF